jgi:hypothetical protein
MLTEVLGDLSHMVDKALYRFVPQRLLPRASFGLSIVVIVIIITIIL